MLCCIPRPAFRLSTIHFGMVAYLYRTLHPPAYDTFSTGLLKIGKEFAILSKDYILLKDPKPVRLIMDR